MIRVSRTEHRPVKVLFDYFERAVAELGLKAWAILLRPGNEQYFHDKVAPSVYGTLDHSPWEQEREQILLDPEKHLRWEPREDPEEEIRAHYRLQSAIVATLMGDSEGIESLAAQLIIEHMNRKLEISYFLGNLTDGKVGSIYPDLPTKAQILQWVHQMSQVRLSDRLPEIAKIKYE